MRLSTNAWRKFAVAVSAAWLALDVSARGLATELIKYADDEGQVRLVEGEGVAEGLARILAVRPHEHERLRRDVAGLLREGVLVVDGALVRFAPKTRTRGSSADRMARLREKRRKAAETSASPPSQEASPTPSLPASLPPSHPPSLSASLSASHPPSPPQRASKQAGSDLDLETQELNKEKQASKPRTREGATDAQPVTTTPSPSPSQPASLAKTSPASHVTTSPPLEERARIIAVLTECEELVGHIHDLNAFARVLQGQAGFREPDDAPLDEVTHYACLQLTTEVSQGKHARPGVRGGVVRAIFRRLLDADQLARARGDDVEQERGRSELAEVTTEQVRRQLTVDDPVRRTEMRPLSSFATSPLPVRKAGAS
jgi:hypothetical protein